MRQVTWDGERGKTAIEAIDAAFPGEYGPLDPRRRSLVIRDYLLAVEEDGINAAEYARRIGRGNLASYADCLVAGART